MNHAEPISRARAHFLAAAGWPRHVANETALEYERLCSLREQGTPVAPEDGSLLHQFSCWLGDGPEATDGAASAARYEQRFGHPPPYPWQAGAVPADANPASG